MKRFSIFPVLIAVLMFTIAGCSSLLENLTKTVTASGDSLTTDINGIISRLEGDIGNMSDSLLIFMESDRMNTLIDSVIRQASESFVGGLNIDSILGLVDDNLDNALAGILDSLLSENVSNELGLRLKEVLEKSGLDPESLKSMLLSEETKAYLVSLKDELLGSSTASQLDTLMEAALKVFEKYYDKTIEPDVGKLSDNLNSINDNLSGTTKKVTGTVWKSAVAFLSAFLIALGSILGFRLYKSKKQTDLIKLLANKIDKIPDQKVYDELTKEIGQAAEVMNLNGILDESIKDLKEKSAKEWQNKDNQVLKLLAKYTLMNKNQSTSGSALESFSGNTLDLIKQEAEQLGLKDHLDSVMERNVKEV